MNLTRTVVVITALIVFFTLGAHIVLNASPSEPQLEPTPESDKTYENDNLPEEEEEKEKPPQYAQVTPDFSGMVGMYKYPPGGMNVWIFSNGEYITLINGEMFDGKLEYLGTNSAKIGGGSTAMYFTVVEDILVLTMMPEGTQVSLIRYT